MLNIRRQKCNFFFQKYNIFLQKRDYLEKLSRKDYHLLKSPNAPDHVEGFWTRKGIQFNQDIWSLPFKSTKETWLRILQWKININV